MSRLFSTTSALALGIFLASSANASDLLGNSAKDAPSDVVSYQAKTNWGGFYIGGAVGYGNSNHDLSVRDYFQDYCADAWDAESEDFDRFDNNDREDTLENINKDVASWTAPWATDSVKLAKTRTACDVRNGRVDDPDTKFDETISVTPNGNTVSVLGDSRESARLDGVNSSGIVGDLRIGADVQRGRFVGGVFASYGLSGMEAEGSSIGGAFTDFSLDRGDDWSVGARAGLLVNDRTLLYILAAYTETEYEFSGTFNEEAFSDTTTFSGVTVGGGIEFAATNNVFLGLEATHTFYGEEVIFDHYDPETNVGTLINDDLGETKILGTLKIKLNSGILGN